MADFRPETTIYLFQYTRVDRNNQPFFTSESQKMGWYFSHLSIAFSGYTYQRTERQYIRVDGKADELRKYDMLAYKNGNGKWILAGITGVEFINPNCAEIYFEMDSMQTYIEDITFHHCWVEREMQENDWKGSSPSFNNLVTENIDVGKLFKFEVPTPSELSLGNGKVVVISTLDENAQPSITPYMPTEPPGVPWIANEIEFTTAEMGRLKIMLDKYAQAEKIDAILAIYFVPNIPVTQNLAMDLPYKDIYGFDVVNAKCFCSEFFNWILSSKNGDAQVLMPEGFGPTSSFRLNIRSSFQSGSGGAFAQPVGYMPYGASELENPARYGVVYPYDTQLAWASAGYYNYASQHIGSIGMSLLGAAVTGGLTMAGGPATILGAAGLSTIVHATTSAAGKQIDSAITPVSGGRMATTTSLRWAINQNGFDFYGTGPSAQNMHAIDDYFSMFGYKTNRLKVPNVNTRPKWNYVKTVGAICSGPFDRTDKLKIQEMLDNGVTFWHVPGVSIGDYSDPLSNKNS